MASSAAAAAAGGARRAEAGTAHTLGQSGCIGTPFKASKDAPFIKARLKLFEELYAKQQAEIAGLPHVPISIELPDGSRREGIAFETTPQQIAAGISKGLANASIVAKVCYDKDVAVEAVAAADAAQDSDKEASPEAASVSPGGCCESRESSDPEGDSWLMWDLTRPLEGSCKLQLLKFDDPAAQSVFWHSSAHILGHALESEFGALLTVGPALLPGFYYDCYMGGESICEEHHAALIAQAEKVIKRDSPYQRLVCSKAEALSLFKENPFKVALILSKVADCQKTTVYRCGDLVDLCRGPHVASTGVCKAFSVLRHSSSYWLGNRSGDSLQRVYGVSFPETKQLKAYINRLEEAKRRDHRLLGQQLSLYFFDSQLSPGSCFWLPEGARLYNKLIAFIRQEYRIRGYREVVSPNLYSCALWKTSGHYDNYKDDMFIFDIEGREWGLKPMNCPGHCLMFKHMAPSYRQLPLRLADFGVLHRNEASGSLGGLTRVRRFQQDDAHIFCRMDQIEEEVKGCLDFLFYVYRTLGFNFSVCLSTRPPKALGDKETWNHAEAALAKALQQTSKPWRLKAGDGAFYGPKIDIQLHDALERQHQCGTIQLDFQLPLRFNLQYKTQEETLPAATAAHKPKQPAAPAQQQQPAAAQQQQPPAPQQQAAAPQQAAAKTADAVAPHPSKVQAEQQEAQQHLKPGMARPVIIHRAILGSIERMAAVLLEHTAGKLPFWLSPRQCIVLPISEKVYKYAEALREVLHRKGYDVGIDLSNNTINKKIREAQLQQWCYLLVVGEAEAAQKTVTVRDSRDPKTQECLSLQQLLSKFEQLGMPCSQAPPDLKEWKREDE